MFALLLIILLKIFAQGHSNIPERYEGLRSDFSYLEDRRPFGGPMMGEASGGAGSQMKIFRLPTTVQPVSYDLKMVPFTNGSANFSGTVIILVHVNSPTKEILLHSHQLLIKSVKVFRYASEMPCEYALMPANQLLSITLSQKLFRGNRVTLKVEFTGVLNDEMVGFYRSSYKMGNSTKWLATTQFEATAARQAFPCFDEPRFRAVFVVSIARHSYQMSISNMPLQKSPGPDSAVENRTWDIFWATPPMPTYLVAFIVGELNFTAGSKGRVKLYARINAIEDGRYGQSQASTLLNDMERIIGIPYTLPKLDVVAVPDFRAGAMENWGLTTFRERYTLYNEPKGSELHKSLVTSVIAHELAHQWFGDLVTISWWDYLWLNEGFATYFEYFLTDVTEPNWRMAESFVVEVVHYALNTDGIFNHDSMNSEVHSPSEIRYKFDAISYDKAGSVIRMIEHVVSPSTFNKSLNLYLRTRSDAGGLAEPSHLYEAFEEQMQKEGKSLPHDLSISALWKKYTNQSGYPCVKVARQQNGGRSNIIIKQETYKSPRSTQNVTEKSWIVPLSCTKQSQPDFANTQPSIWLVDKKEVFLSNEVRNDEWYICNLQQTGYYRVNYDLENWNLLIEQLRSDHMKIHQLNRANLIDDCYTFVIDEMLPFPILFDLLRYLDKEFDPIAWFTALHKILDLIQNYESTAVASELIHFLKHRVEHFYTSTTFYEKASDTPTLKRLRSLLTWLACKLEINDCVRNSLVEFSRNDLSQIPGYVKETALCTAYRKNSTLSTWNRYWDYYRGSNSHYEQETVLMALGCAFNETLLKKYLYKLLDDNDHEIRKQHQYMVIRSVNRFPTGIIANINFIHDIMPRLGNFTKAHEIIITLLNSIDGKVQSHDQMHRLDHLLEEANSVDQLKYGDIKETALRVKANAIKIMAKNERMAERIGAALKPVEPTPGPKPSAASCMVPQAVMVGVVFISKWLCH